MFPRHLFRPAVLPSIYRIVCLFTVYLFQSLTSLMQPGSSGALNLICILNTSLLPPTSLFRGLPSLTQF